MLTFFDYANIVFYFAFIVGVGLYFARKSKDTSDYFRGGGALPWWVTGASAWMAGFSAWTFTGAAGKIYDTGLYPLVLYYANLAAAFVLFWGTARRFRRMRVVTPLEAVRLRFGPKSQQFYTWMRLPIMVIFGGLGLNAVGVFMSAVFGVDLVPTLIFLGVVVTTVSLLGGSFGVAASDFVQMLVVVTVAVVVSILALAQPAVGGLSGLFDKLPERHFDWSEFTRPSFVIFWFLALSIGNIISQNSMDNSAKYLMLSSDRDARKMLIIPFLGALFGPIIWFIPSLSAAITHPDLGTQFPALPFPQEAAFLATSQAVLPAGMLGLLICGIFAATLTTLDASLNQSAGIFVRNFYLPIINPDSSERRLLIMSKLATGVMGLLTISLALFVAWLRATGRAGGLFDLITQVATSIMLPMSVPLFLGLYFRRTPGWSTWTTVLIGLATAWFVKFRLVPADFAFLPGFSGPHLPEETTTFYIFATIFIVGPVCIGWFFLTSLFYQRQPAAYREEVDAFFNRLSTPYGGMDNEKPRENFGLLLAIGKLSMIYGGFIGLFSFVPNSPTGRLCFLIGGGSIIAMGFLLFRIYKPKAAAALAAAQLKRLE
ncbi:MAG: hypothetical protein MUE42_01105 [Opitutaceae bacterium]|jgi:Na+/proline symporter|nr:hypothetical protein [Opitutaceae bacterium]